MKSVSTAFRNILFGGGTILRADLLTVTMLSGLVYRFTSSDIDLTVAGQTYDHTMAFSRQGTTQSIGTDPDSIDIELYDDSTNRFSGASLMTAVAAGLFNGAIIQLDKLALSSWQDTSPGICGWFYGEVSTSKSQSGVATITAKSMVNRLSVAMPPTIIQPSCNNGFGDARCGFNVATVTFSGTCTGGTQLQPTASLTDHQFDLGKIKFITGANAGVTRSIKYNAGGVIYLSYPLPNIPQAGDTFNISQGCFRTQAACNTYGNLPRFKGMPYVPQPETALEGGSGVSGTSSDTGTSGVSVSGSITTASVGTKTYAQ
jgi:uncharacterized phage protein (TIGR02218 family)